VGAVTLDPHAWALLASLGGRDVPIRVEFVAEDRGLCRHCGHRGWPHGDQSGWPADGEPCHAAVGVDYADQCACPGYAAPTTDPTTKERTTR